MAISQRQEEVLAAIIKETKRSACPTLGRIVECSGVHVATVQQALARLEELGYVKQSYDRGPYVPLCKVDGTPLEIHVVEISRQAAGWSAGARLFSFLFSTRYPIPIWAMKSSPTPTRTF